MSALIRDKETLHGMLNEAHQELRSAADKIHRILLTLYDAGRYPDEREKLQPAVHILENARSAADDAMKKTSESGLKIISLTGCDGSCAPQGG